MHDPTDQPGFGSAWDEYVDDAKAAGQQWPGDDWGDESQWRQWFERLFVPHGVATWQRAIEIGQGTGKYTRMVLDAGSAEVLACDVSAKFLELCGKRLESAVTAGRLTLVQIAEDDPDSLITRANERGWVRQVDAIYSIDTLVHVPLTFVVAYLLQGTAILREGGVFVLSFANGMTDAGRTKLLGDTRRVVAASGAPVTGCFHWITPDLLADVARSIGYRVEICDADPVHGRDGHFVGVLEDVDAARAWRGEA